MHEENLNELDLNVLWWDGDIKGLLLMYTINSIFCCLPLQRNRAGLPTTYLNNINYLYITATTKSQIYYREQSQWVKWSTAFDL